jgi:hypothetical protein
MRNLFILVILLCAAVSVEAQTLKIVRSATVDLDGDGRPEKVSISIGSTSLHSAHYDYVLHANGASVAGRLEYVEGFAVIDLDTHDRYKEIAVYTPGPSDDFEYAIYWYDGKQLRQTGDIGRKIRIQGNGIVLADWWTGNFFVRDKYVLEKSSHKLRMVPQEMYYVGEPHKVLESFSIYKFPGSKDVIATLAKESKILVVAIKFSGDRARTCSIRPGLAAHQIPVRYTGLGQAEDS